MKNTVLYCFVSDIRLEDLESDFKLLDNFTVSTNEENIESQLLTNTKYESLSEEDYRNIKNCCCVIKVEMKEDSPDERKVALKHIYYFMALLRVVKTNTANPHYYIMRHGDDFCFPIGPHNTIAQCYGLEMNLLYDYEKAVRLGKEPSNEDKEKKLLTAVLNLKRISVVDLDKTKELWSNVEVINKNNLRVNTALRLYETAYCERFREFRTLYFAMALESLFATTDAELTFSLALRTTRFLEKNYRNRKEIFKDICISYDIRSRIVHGLVSKITTPELKHAEFTFRENLRRSLFSIASDSSLINKFDDIGEHKSYLKQLVLNDDTGRISM